MNVGKIIALFFGIIFLISGLGMFVGGVGVFAVSEIFSDDDGYLSSPVLNTNVPNQAVAMVFTDIEINTDKFDGKVRVDLGLDYGNFITIKLTVDGPEDYFIGIAETSSLVSYLENVTYASIENMDFDSGFQVSSTLIHPEKIGVNATPIANQTMVSWDAQGDNDNVLLWEPKEGNWAFVLMKADGTANLQPEITVGAKIPLLTMVAVFLIVIGLVFVVIAIVLFIIAVRSSKTRVVSMPYYGVPPTQGATQPQTTTPGSSQYGTPSPKVSRSQISEQQSYPESTSDESVFVVAEYGPRILAFIIDAIIISLVLDMFRWPLLFANPQTDFFFFGISTFSVNTVGMFLYFMFAESYYGTTIGKEIMKLRTITEGGDKPELKDSAISAAGKAFFLPIDFIIGLFIKNNGSDSVPLNQRFSQTISKTLVIVKPPENSPARAKFSANK